MRLTTLVGPLFPFCCLEKQAQSEYLGKDGKAEQATEYVMHRLVPDIIAADQTSDLSEKKRPVGDDQWTADPPTP